MTNMEIENSFEFKGFLGLTERRTNQAEIKAGEKGDARRTKVVRPETKRQKKIRQGGRK